MHGKAVKTGVQKIVNVNILVILQRVPRCPVETDSSFSLLSLLFTHRAGSRFDDKLKHKKKEKVPILCAYTYDYVKV